MLRRRVSEREGRGRPGFGTSGLSRQGQRMCIFIQLGDNGTRTRVLPRGATEMIPGRSSGPRAERFCAVQLLYSVCCCRHSSTPPSPRNNRFFAVVICGSSPRRMSLLAHCLPSTCHWYWILEKRTSRTRWLPCAAVYISLLEISNIEYWIYRVPGIQPDKRKCKRLISRYALRFTRWRIKLHRNTAYRSTKERPRRARWVSAWISLRIPGWPIDPEWANDRDELGARDVVTEFHNRPPWFGSFLPHPSLAQLTVGAWDRFVWPGTRRLSASCTVQYHVWRRTIDDAHSHRSSK